MRLREGRLFRAEDRTSAYRPILVNETFAKTYFTDGRPATGRSFPGMFPNWLGKETVVEVIGVVEDMLPAALDGRTQSQIFVAEGRGANIGHVTLVVQTNGNPAAAAPMLRDVVRQIDPRATVERMGPLEAKIWRRSPSRASPHLCCSRSRRLRSHSRRPACTASSRPRSRFGDASSPSVRRSERRATTS